MRAEGTMRVLLVTSWGNKCGIAEYAAMLKASVEAADPEIEVIPNTDCLNPDMVQLVTNADRYDLIHLNHHDALHSRWWADHVELWMARGIPVVVTYHDTRETLAECPKLEALSKVAASTIVHEQVEGLKAIYWRQGIPAPASGPYMTGIGRASALDSLNLAFKSHLQQPVLGSVGFNFPWKNFTRLAQETGRMGWALMIISHDADDAAVAEWYRLNPHLTVLREFAPREQVIGLLAACDATAFMYECANTGTSAAIRQGIAARKPVIAFSNCRQFRDLVQLDYTGDPELEIVKSGIRWADNWQTFRYALQTIRPGAFDPAINHLAHMDSWARLGGYHALLYRGLVQKEAL